MKKTQTLQKKAQTRVESVEHFLKFLALNRPLECLELTAKVEQLINDEEVKAFQDACDLFDQESSTLDGGESHD